MNKCVHISVSVRILAIIAITTFITYASQLKEISVLDRDCIMLHFLDGEVTFKDDGKGEHAYENHTHVAGMDTVHTYNPPLAISSAGLTERWLITSETDANYSTTGKNPRNCYRKSKLNGMAEKEWNTGTNDFNYEYTMEHFIYLTLPFSLVQEASYTVKIDNTINSDRETASITFDIYSCRSEAIHVNLIGYPASSSIKAVDVYHWMGDGGARDYKNFEGNEVYIYNSMTGEKSKAGTVTFWKKSAQEAQWYNLTGSSVWNADISTFSTPGTYRIAIDGIGCSQDVIIADDVYYEPFRVSVLGFFYMRIGQDSTGGIQPVPRRPLWLPGKDPAGTMVYLTTMHPFHNEWETFSYGDVWDRPESWAVYRKNGNPVNPDAWGGHSDALDWDRHLGHVPIIYDMLLPYILTGGKIADDDLGIAESGNGIPDIIDEARNEVDFWLRLRDGVAYSHGLTNPDDDNVLYQAGTTAIAAWANALNAGMLADCFRIAGKEEYADTYRDSAAVAYQYASSLADQMLETPFEAGETIIRGRDFKMMAAAFLYNLTGDRNYEDVVNTLSDAKTTSSGIQVFEESNQLWGTAGYLCTPQIIHYPELASRMKASIIAEAKMQEANYSTVRPSRRGSDNNTGYFQTEQNMHRTMVAHTVTDNAADRELFYHALVLEADWGLGRNPLNLIQMTTASTNLQAKRSIENIYTSGDNDGTPGMHPGHTPYLNVDDWSKSMVMGRPSWMYEKGYPAQFSSWPKAEAYFNTRYVWAHSEFTPQQTMRGKTALYGYLYGIGATHVGIISKMGRSGTSTPCIPSRMLIVNGMLRLPVEVYGPVCLLDCAGRVLWRGVAFDRRQISIPVSLIGRNGLLLVEYSNRNGIVMRGVAMVVR